MSIDNLIYARSKYERDKQRLESAKTNIETAKKELKDYVTMPLSLIEKLKQNAVIDNEYFDKIRLEKIYNSYTSVLYTIESEISYASNMIDSYNQQIEAERAAAQAAAQSNK